jgi:hypothetical protein
MEVGPMLKTVLLAVKTAAVAALVLLSFTVLWTFTVGWIAMHELVKQSEPGFVAINLYNPGYGVSALLVTAVAAWLYVRQRRARSSEAR